MYSILRKLPLLPLLVVLSVSLAGPAWAGDSFLVRDMDVTEGEVVSGGDCCFQPDTLYQGSYPRDLVSLEDRVVFAATDRIHGSELWSSDGTVEGTRRITDLCPGDCNSVAAIVGVLKDRVFFWASDDPALPPHLWSSDGTASGTTLVAEVCDSPCHLAKSEWERFGQLPWPANARAPMPFHAVFGDRLFFFAAGGDGTGPELWATDGTPAGTRRMADHCPGECSWVPIFLVAGGDGIYAVGYDASSGFLQDYEVWYAGPEDAAARQIFSSPLSGPTGPPLRMNDVEVVDGVLHVAVEGENGRPPSLWRVTPQEALLLWQAEFTPGTFTDLTEAGGDLYFVQVDRVFQPGPRTEGIYDLWVLEDERARRLSERFSSMRGGVELPDGRLAIVGQKELRVGTAEIYTTSGQALEKWSEYPGRGQSVVRLREVDGQLLIQGHELPLQVWVGDGDDHLHRLLELPMGNHPELFWMDDLDHWAAAGDYLFFGADDPEVGWELWAVPRRSLEPRASQRLLDGRFDVSVLFENQHAGDEVGAAVARRLTEDSSQFWFFREENTELVVKVLDGFGVNGHAWVFHGGTTNLGYRVTVRDRETDRTRVYHRPPGTLCGAGDTTAFELFSPLGGNGSVPSVASVAPSAAPAARSSRSTVEALDLPAACDPGTALCLGGGRFQVRVRFRNHRADGAEGVGQPVADTDRAGWFWFFDPDNTEVMVKVLDGRPVNGYHWVLWGGLTDLEYELEVNDLLEGVTRTYHHPAGDLCGGADTSAFTTSDPSTALQTAGR